MKLSDPDARTVSSAGWNERAISRSSARPLQTGSSVLLGQLTRTVGDLYSHSRDTWSAALSNLWRLPSQLAATRSF